jgi:hypothetical protein
MDSQAARTPHKALNRVLRALNRRQFTSSSRYWQRHYARGGDSGGGSYGRLAQHKASVLNDLVREHNVSSVVEWGCGDGNQLALANYPRYLGLDVSERSIQLCSDRFRDDHTKSFVAINPSTIFDRAGFFVADLALSLDVVYHLVEHDVFERHLELLFASSRRLVAIYGVDADRPRHAPHVLFRRFTDHIASTQPDWTLLARIPNPFPHSGDDRTGSDSEFFVYAKSTRSERERRA